MKHLFKTSVSILLLSSRVLAEPTVNIETKYYAIYGSTADELRKEMDIKSSIAQSGNTYDAYTSWYVNWNFNWKKRNDRCFIKNVSSTVSVRFIYPRWINRDDSNDALKNKWDRYYRALIDHENGHKFFAITAANEIEENLPGLSPSDSCSLLEQKANALAEKILDKYIALEQTYDENTRHGINNGAKFP